MVIALPYRGDALSCVHCLAGITQAEWTPPSHLSHKLVYDMYGDENRYGRAIYSEKSIHFEKYKFEKYNWFMRVAQMIEVNKSIKKLDVVSGEPSYRWVSARKT